MDLLVLGRPDLAHWEARPERASHGDNDHADSYERDIASEPPGPPVDDGPHRRAAAAILAYDIFPANLIEPIVRRAPVEVGDTVGAHYVGFPLVRVFFASRVIERFDAERDGWWRTGFTYRTLAHHPELGEETFSVEKQLASGRVRVALRSWSRPGTWLTRVMSPLLRRVQVGASNGALDHLASRALRREGERARAAGA
jgi:uncharacterized protein (UPF0548 family)